VIATPRMCSPTFLKAVDWSNMARPPVSGPVVIPNCLEMKLHWTLGGARCSNVLHGMNSFPAPLDPTLAEQLFAAMKANTSTTAFLGICTPGLAFTGVSVKDLRTANQADLPSTGGAALGTSADPPLASNAALVVTLRTAQSGQGFRGRIYLLGLVASTLDDANTFSDATNGIATAFVEGIRQVMSTNTMPMGVAQRALGAGTHHDGSPWAARPADIIPVVSVDVANTRVDSQRRRLGR